jgi:hypothetical protein
MYQVEPMSIARLLNPLVVRSRRAAAALLVCIRPVRQVSRVPRPLGAARGRSALLAACLLGTLAGCASPPTLRTEVTRFHDWTSAEPLTVAFRRDTPQAQTLEHRSYERLLAQRLVALGFTESDLATARYQAAFTFEAVPEPRRVTEFWSTGGMGAYPFGPGPWLGPRSVSGYPFGRFDPLWSIPPVPISRDITVWRHELRVDLYDMRGGAPPGRKVFESRAVAVAESQAMPQLMPGLVSAAMSDFPGNSGETRRVEVELPEPAK